MKRKIIAIFLTVLMIFVVISSWERTVSATDYSAWSYYRQVWVDQTNVDTDLVNFPVLVSISDTIGDLCNADGGDIRFCSSDNNTAYPYNIEKWVDGSNRLIWVRVPRIDDVVNTTFWMYYGNAAATLLTNWTDVFSSYNYVLHMNGTTTIQDYTANNHDGTSTADADTGGVVGSCQLFTRANVDKVNMGDNNDFSYGDGTNDVAFTLSCWVKPVYTSTGTTQYFMYFGKDAASNREYQVVYRGSDVLPWQFQILIFDASASKYQYIATGTITLSKTAYQLLTFTYTGSKLANGLNVYVNGTKFARTCYNMTGYVAMENKADSLYLGDYGYDDTSNYNGYMDEVRAIRSTCANASWIKAEYYSIVAPSTFVQIGFQRTTFVNNPPVNVNPFPVVGTTGNILSPRLIITIVDPDGDTMNTTFKTNVTGVWGIIGVNSSVPDGTYSWVNDSMNEYRTRYWWNVSTNDGMGGWDNDTYWFSTYSGILVSSYYPVNHSLNQLKNITYHVHLIHTNGTTMNISCYRDNGTIYLGEYLNIHNGTYYFFSNASTSNTVYWWCFNITDEATWYNSTQWYETGTSSGGGGVILIGNGDISIGSYMVTGIIIGLSFGGLLCIRTWRKRRQKHEQL